MSVQALIHAVKTICCFEFLTIDRSILPELKDHGGRFRVNKKVPIHLGVGSQGDTKPGGNE